MLCKGRIVKGHHVDMRPTVGKAVSAIAGGLALAALFASCSSSPVPKSSATTTAGPGAALAGAIPMPPAGTVTTAEDAACSGSTSCYTVGNVSTLTVIPGLFEGASVGVNAYLTYVNATGGVNGRKFKELVGDDAFSCDQDKAQTQTLIPKVDAFVGSFSLYDNCGGDVLASHPDVPNIGVPLNNSALLLGNTFSPVPQQLGWNLGPLLAIKKMYPKAISQTGALVADVTSSKDLWVGEKAALQSVGYDVTYVDYYNPLQTDFTADAVKFAQEHVRALDLTNLSEDKAAELLRALAQQGYLPDLIFSGGPLYTASYPKDVGPTIAARTLVFQPQAMYLGEDAKAVPAVASFLAWVHKVEPGFQPDAYTLFGWASAELYVQAVRAAGTGATGPQIEAALKAIHTFDADGLIAPAGPATKAPATCYLMMKVVDGAWHRFDTPASAYNCGSWTYYLYKQ